MAGVLMPALPFELEERILGLLEPHEVICTVRLVCKAAAARYRGSRRLIVRLSHPVPRHAFARRCQANSGAWIKSLPFKQRLKLLCLTATSGDLVNLELAVRAAGCVLKDEMMEAAAAAGHVHVCQLLRQHGCPWGNALPSAAKAGRQEMCEWLLASGCRDTGCLREAMRAAARAGHLGLSEWLRQQLPLGEATATSGLLVSDVAHGCDLAALQRYFLAWRQVLQQQQQQQQQQQEGANEGGQQQQQQQQQELHHEMLAEDVLAAACSSTTPDWVDKVCWLEAQGCPRSELAAAEAARLPAEAAVERLRWLRERGYPLGELAVDLANVDGNVAALEYLLEEAGVVVGFAPRLSPAYLAARTGNLAALQRRHASGRPVDPAWCLLAAAEHKHLDVVFWLADTFGLTAADLQRRAVLPAAGSGSLELVDWLAGRGCDFRREGDALTKAAEGGCEAVLERLVELGCRIPACGRPYYFAALHGDTATLRCLRRLGCPWGPGDRLKELLHTIYPCAPLAALRWLVEAGCPVNWADALAVARRTYRGEDRSELLAWLEEGSRGSQQGG